MLSENWQYKVLMLIKKRWTIMSKTQQVLNKGGKYVRRSYFTQLGHLYYG